jgi:transposase
MSYANIAKKIKVAKSTLIKWNKDFEEEILKRRNEHLNDLRDEYLVSEIKRVELFGERLKSVRAEIEKKGLGELKIGQLLALEGKYVKFLEE